MNASIYLLGIALQALAAVWAFLEVRRAPRKLPWLLVALSAALIVVRRLETFGAVKGAGHEVAASELMTLAVSLCFFAGVVLMGRMFRDMAALEVRLKDSALAREASEDRLAALFAMVRHGLVIQDAEGRIIQANPAAERILGLSLEQMQGRSSLDPCWRSLYPDGTPFPGSEHPAMVALRTGEVVEDVLIGVFNPVLGDTRWLHVSAAPMTDPGMSRPSRVCVSFVDLTDLRREEAARHLADARLAEAFGASPIGKALVGIDGRFLAVNGVLAELLDFSEAELLERTYREVTLPEDLGGEAELLQGLMEGRYRTFQLEKRYLRKGGTVVWAQVNVSLVRDPEGHPLHLVAQIQDIGARRRAESQRAMTLGVLDIANQVTDPVEAARGILEVLRRELDLEALALRLVTEEGCQTVAQVGFTQAVPEGLAMAACGAADSHAEALCARFCRRVVQGHGDPGITSGGSLWISDALDLDPGVLTCGPGLCPPGFCMPQACRTLAVVPMRVGGRILGVLQCHDARPNRLTSDQVGFLEELSASIGLALDRKQALEALARSEENFQATIRAAGVGIWDWNVQTGETIFSERWAEIVGYTLAELGTPSIQTWADLAHPEDLERSETVLEQHFRGETPDYRCETRMKHKAGHWVWVLDCGRVLTWTEDGKPLRMLGTHTDITDLKRVEEALRDSERKFAQAFQSAPVIMSLADLESGRFVDVNEAFLETSGFTREDVLGRTSMEVGWLRAEDRAHILGVVRAEGRISNLELSLRAKDGRTVLCLYSGERLVLSGREYLLSSAQDITEWRQTALALRETMETSQHLVEALPTGLFLYDYEPPDRLVLRSGNPEAERLTGLRVSDWVGRDFDELWPEARSRGLRDRYLDAIRTGTPQELEDVHYEDHRISGTYRIRVFALPGQLLAVAFEDITARKAAEAQVARQAEELSLFFRTSPDLLCVATTGGVFLRLNEEWERVLGFRVSELEGQRFLDLVHPQDLESTLEAVQVLVRGEEVTAFVNRYRCRDGSYRSLEWKAAAVGGVIYAAARDITERLVAEATQRDLNAQLHHAQKMESLGSLAGGVAHDLNNVLGAILSLASGHRARIFPPDPLASALDTIISACTRGRDVVRSLLLFSRKDLEEVRPVDLNAVVRDLVQLLSRTTLQRVELSVDLQEGLPRVMGDGSALSHAVINLCVNAVDAMPAGGHLALSTQVLPTGEIALRVKDSGIGMTPEVLEKAVDPFFTTKPRGQGTGLGLAMVYGTMQAHDGALDLHSRVGEGTEVTLRFPVARLESAPDPAPVGERREAESRPFRILVVDDDELILESVVPMLQLLGHEVQGVQGGREALHRLAQGLEVDLVILDMNMPGMGGAEVLPKLLALRPGQAVVIATGYVESRVQDLLAAHPTVRCLSKPYTLGEISELIGTLPVAPGSS